MKNIRRVCGAILRENTILMVRHQETDRSYWTLPGGSVESGETPEQAAVREAQEETCLQTRVVRLLFEEPHHRGTPGWWEQCYLLEVLGGSARLGYDPEEAHLAPESRLLCDIRWFPLNEKQSDGQVAHVLAALEADTP